MHKRLSAMPGTLTSVTLHDNGNGGFLKQEKDIALSALCEDAVFQPEGTSTGPYSVDLRIEDGRLVVGIQDGAGAMLPVLVLSVRPYTRLVRDYFMMIESYERVRRTGTPDQLEAVDMGRRGLHDEGARLLQERLAGKITMDHETARRFFTLICVLHAQNVPVL